MPKKVAAAARRNKQLLIRITDGELEVLEAASHLRRMTPNSYASELLRTHLSRLLVDPYVRRDIANRQAFDQVHVEVTPIVASPESDRVHLEFQDSPVATAPVPGTTRPTD